MKSIISTLALPLLFFFMTAFSWSGPLGNASSGADTFKAKCSMCHGPNGSGNTPMGQKMKVHDLRSPEVQTQTDDKLTAISMAIRRPPNCGPLLSPKIEPKMNSPNLQLPTKSC
jgi:hypothetical protein